MAKKMEKMGEILDALYECCEDDVCCIDEGQSEEWRRNKGRGTRELEGIEGMQEERVEEN